MREGKTHGEKQCGEEIPPPIAMEREQAGGKGRDGRGDIFRQILPPHAEDEAGGVALLAISCKRHAGQLFPGGCKL